jgi:hypothetical protein
MAVYTKNKYTSICHEMYVYKSYLNLNSVNHLIFVMVKCGVLFEVRAEFLNNI